MAGSSGFVPSGHAAGLTLIELLVVMFILGLGWFALLPNLDLSRDQDKKAQSIQEVNTLLATARKRAMTEGITQEIVLPVGKRYLELNATKAELPNILSSVQVNGWTAVGADNVLRVYPEGFMDEVRMIILGGGTLVGKPLTATLAWSE